MDFADPLQALIPGATGRVLAVLVHPSVPLSVGRSQSWRVSVRAQALGCCRGSQSLVTRSSRSRRRRCCTAWCVSTWPRSHWVALGEFDDAILSALGRRVGARMPACVWPCTARSPADRPVLTATSTCWWFVPRGPGEDDEERGSTVGQIRATASRLSGKRVEIMEVAQDDVRQLVGSNRRLCEAGRY
jgi:hypothetical protein